MKNNCLIYKRNILEALEALANYQFQKVAWFPNDQGLMYSYNENILDLFYDSTLDGALKAGETVFGAKADKSLRDLELASAEIDGADFSEEILINLPQMQKIREKAAQALALVKTSISAESTVEIIE